MKKLLFIPLLFIAVILKAETKIVGYEYAIPKTEAITISYLDVMVGTRDSTELYEKISRKGISTTLDTAVKDGKAYKVILVQNQDEPNKDGVYGITITPIGIMPADLNYDSAKEREKLILAEMAKIKEVREAKIRAEAIAVVDAVVNISK